MSNKRAIIVILLCLLVVLHSTKLLSIRKAISRTLLSSTILSSTGLFFNNNPTLAAEYSRSIKTSIDYYDYKVGDEDAPYAKPGDRIVFNYKGRLPGRQGWLFDDTFVPGSEPQRITLGVTNCIPGLDIGIAGDGDKMLPMRKGGKRRIIIPARLGYTGKDQCPIPADFGQQQRLYSTVLNDIRGDQERVALGDSLAGIVVLDVEIIKIYPPKTK